MGIEITCLHHVGHVVRDLASCIELYRRLGFSVGPASCPVVQTAPGKAPMLFGVANAHVEFSRNFVELATVVSDPVRLPVDVALTPVRVPEAALPSVLDALRRTIGKLAGALARFEGLHILVLGTSDIAKSVASFEAADVRHGGVSTVARDIKTEQGGKTVPIRSLEIDREPVPEGRLAVAEVPPPESLRVQSAPAHPNGATALVEAILCVAPIELDAFDARYARYLGRHARRTDFARIFEFNDATITLVEPSGLARMLPGEQPASLPAFVAYAVTVQNLDDVKAQLSRSGLPARASSTGDIFVPAAAALGVAVIFRVARP
jgi:hypothetical protein